MKGFGEKNQSKREQIPKNKQKERLKIKNLSLGKGHIKNGRLISKPMDFTEKNFISIPKPSNVKKTISGELHYHLPLLNHC